MDSSDSRSSAITLVNTGRLDEEEGAYVMTRRVMVWEAHSHEYVYFFTVPHLDMQGLEKAIAESYKLGMECIEPGPKHRSSYIATVIVADTADEDALRYIAKFQKRENFNMSLHGWMDQLVGVALPDKIVVSPKNKRMEDILEYSLFLEAYREKRKGLKGFFRKLFR